MDELHQKYETLLTILRSYENVAVAFSAGVDSTLLLKAAKNAGLSKLVAITARSCFFPERESREADSFCKAEGIEQIFLDIDELAIPGVADNPPNRCYLCKKALFTQLQTVAADHGIQIVCEGSNMDDMGDYRPGLQAIRELGIASPLRDARLYKAEIRKLSKELELNTWAKPSFACLASRFPYGKTITQDALERVDKAEQLLLRMGFSQFRVRCHEDLARIEVLPEEIAKVIEHKEDISKALKEYGFAYTALDLTGYRQGSLNETLK